MREENSTANRGLPGVGNERSETQPLTSDDRRIVGRSPIARHRRRWGDARTAPGHEVMWRPCEPNEGRGRQSGLYVAGFVREGPPDDKRPVRVGSGQRLEPAADSRQSVRCCGRVESATAGPSMTCRFREEGWIAAVGYRRRRCPRLTRSTMSSGQRLNVEFGMPEPGCACFT